jgi:hypothetical protein
MDGCITTGGDLFRKSLIEADADRITSTVIWLVTRAIELSVEVAKSRGDDATVLDATAAGLRMLPNDDYFSKLRSSFSWAKTE